MILTLQKRLMDLVLDDNQFYRDILETFEHCKGIQFDSYKDLDDFVKNRFNREDYENITDDEYTDLQFDIVLAFADYHDLYL